MHEVKRKKRKLHLDRETILPMQRNSIGTNLLAGVNGGKDSRDPRDRTLESVQFSAASGASVSLAVAGPETVGPSGAVSGVASAVGASIDAASERLNVPCWVPATTVSAMSRATRR